MGHNAIETFNRGATTGVSCQLLANSKRRTLPAPILPGGYRFGPFDELAIWNIAGSSGVIFWIDQEGAKPIMATYKLAEILKSRSDLNDDEIQHMSEDEAWQLLRTGMPMRELAHEGQGDSEHQ